MSLISAAGIRHIMTTKCHCTQDHSVIAHYIDQYYWSPTAQLLPVWLAPNAITLLGLLAVVLSFTYVVLQLCIINRVTALIYPEWRGGLSVVGNVMACSSVFIFQSMDNWDGKQARRIGYSTALGMLSVYVC